MSEQNWEYENAIVPHNLLLHHDALNDYLRAFGAQGWELVSVVETGVGCFAFFKRPRDG